MKMLIATAKSREEDVLRKLRELGVLGQIAERVIQGRKKKKNTECQPWKFLKWWMNMIIIVNSACDKIVPLGLETFADIFYTKGLLRVRSSVNLFFFVGFSRGKPV